MVLFWPTFSLSVLNPLVLLCRFLLYRKRDFLSPLHYQKKSGRFRVYGCQSKSNLPVNTESLPFTWHLRIIFFQMVSDIFEFLLSISEKGCNDPGHIKYHSYIYSFRTQTRTCLFTTESSSSSFITFQAGHKRRQEVGKWSLLLSWCLCTFHHQHTGKSWYNLKTGGMTDKSMVGLHTWWKYHISLNLTSKDWLEGRAHPAVTIFLRSHDWNSCS